MLAGQQLLGMWTLFHLSLLLLPNKTDLFTIPISLLPCLTYRCSPLYFCFPIWLFSCFTAPAVSWACQQVSGCWSLHIVEVETFNQRLWPNYLTCDIGNLAGHCGIVALRISTFLSLAGLICLHTQLTAHLSASYTHRLYTLESRCAQRRTKRLHSIGLFSLFVVKRCCEMRS